MPNEPGALLACACPARALKQLFGPMANGQGHAPATPAHGKACDVVRYVGREKADLAHRQDGSRS